MNEEIAKLEKEQEDIYLQLQPLRDQTNLVENLRVKRDELNSQVQELSKKARVLKAERDKYNQQVFEEKQRRDQLNLQKNTLREVMPQKSKFEYRRLQDQVKALQFKIERSGVAFEEEKKLRKQLLGLNAEYMRMKNFARLRTKASEFHKKIKDISLESNRTHTDLVKLYDQIKALRATADEAHNGYIAASEKIKELKDTFSPLMQRSRAIRSEIDDTKNKHAASEAFEIKKTMKERATEATKKLEAGKKVDLRDLQLQFELDEKKGGREERK